MFVQSLSLTAETMPQPINDSHSLMVKIGQACFTASCTMNQQAYSQLERDEPSAL
jgi:hypothetical protein